MKIVIIGGGISGLALYLHLRKHLDAVLDFPAECSISILERHLPDDISHSDDVTTASSFTGGLGLAPNGMHILRRLSADLYHCVCHTGFEVDSFSFRTSGAWNLGSFPACGSTSADGTVMIERKSLWKALRNAVLDIDNFAIQDGVQVETVHESGTMIFQDGRQEQADLIIGADGVWSTARKGVLAHTNEDFDPEFQGLMNIGGYVPIKYLEREYPSPNLNAVMTFGSTGFIGYAPISSIHPDPGSIQSSGRAVWWSTYASSSSPIPKTTLSPSDLSLRTAFQQRHGRWQDPVIKAMVRDLSEQHISSKTASDATTLDVHLPTYVLPKLPHWSRGRIILIGDAAHALPSTSGQGVSMALEDTCALSMILAEEIKALRAGDPTVSGLPAGSAVRVGMRFERLRKPRVESILDEALQQQNKKRNLSTVEEVLMYVILWLVTHVFGKGAVAWKYDYDVEQSVREMQATEQ